MGFPRLSARTVTAAAVAAALGLGGLIFYLESGVEDEPKSAGPAAYDPDIALASPEGLFETADAFSPPEALKAAAAKRGAGVLEPEPAEKRSVSEIRKAAREGDARSQGDLGLLYQEGRGVPRDPARAADWLRKAAEAGDLKAQNNLGSLYYRGDGVRQDLDKAYEWYLRAGEHGNVTAQLNLAVMFAQGRGVGQDHTVAAEYYLRAAKAGDPRAQFDLSVLLAQGLGVEQNMEEALRWRELAAAQGYPEAGYGSR